MHPFEKPKVHKSSKRDLDPEASSIIKSEELELRNPGGFHSRWETYHYVKEYSVGARGGRKKKKKKKKGRERELKFYL